MDEKIHSFLVDGQKKKREKDLHHEKQGEGKPKA
jgi:hypothetical protein